MIERRKPIKRNKYFIRSPSQQKWFEFKAAYMQEKTQGLSHVRCHYCNKEVRVGEITLDHKVPKSRDKSLVYDEANLVFACYTCNREKGSQSEEVYRAKIKVQP